MGILGAGIVAALKATAAAAAKGTAKAAGTSSTKSSSSSRGSSSSGSSGTGGSGSRPSGGSGTYTPLGSHNDQTIKDTSVEDSAQMAAIKKRYAEAQARGDVDAMKSSHADAEALRAQYGYSGGEDGSDYISKGYVSGNVLGNQLGNQLGSGFDAYEQKMNAAAEAQQKALKAKVDSAVASLQSQKGDIAKQTAANNAAAEKAYMQSIKPGGSTAENLAANGLLTSGLTESSQISAGNAYQNALNSNATTQTEALAKIEQAITQARLTGDIEAANALADLYKEIAAKGYENTQNIIAANQWGQQFGLSQAEQTGTYNGQATLAARQLELQKRQVEQDLEAGKIDMETARKQLLYIQAQIDNLNAETEGQKLQNKYYQTQF